MISPRRARALREHIAANRCAAGPGITHRWSLMETYLAPMGSTHHAYACVKCDTWRDR